VLRRIFGPERDEMQGGWWELHIEEVFNLYSSPNIIRTITSRSMKFAEHAARMRWVLVGKSKGKITR
jgi:hypothetical protein